VSDEVHHNQARDALLMQVVHGVRVFFAKYRHQHIGTGDFFFAVAGGLHMHDGALNDALKTQRGLGVHIVVTRHLRRVVLDEVGKGLAQIIDVGRAGT
jgi:Flp pilus assembly protein protease CpaA